MDLRAVFDTVTSPTLLAAFILVGLCCHVRGALQFAKHCSLYWTYRSLTEAEVLGELRRLHLELCRRRGTQPSDDLSCLASCPQLSLMLETLMIEEDGCVNFTYRPWRRVDESEI